MFPESFTRRYRRFWGPDPARDVNEELAFHIEMRVEALIRSGMTEAEAREATMQRFGNLAQIRDECEELSEERVRLRRKADRLDAVRQDLRFALRTFAANPTLKRFFAGQLKSLIVIPAGRSSTTGIHWYE